MSPVEGQMMMVPPNPGPGTIPLSVLIDYILQRTYHELNVLSELLPRKTDMERKTEIVQFASRTRQLFIRLLSLVKWANSAQKVDKCSMICNFLDQQTWLFVETADNLARTARETLLQARLPCFSIPCAIDVLTTGSYPRLPACIKERIIPPDPITVEEKKETLLRLNQIIEHRLVTSELPSHMRRPVIKHGRVKFRVTHEFEVTLTLMGEGAHIPWRLLDIEILVEDPETGGGIALVHSLQLNYIHELLQNRLLDNDRPLHDLYNVLHSFCQSLQLEVLHSQAQRLIHHRLGDCVRIEEYIPGNSLIISYWRDVSRREKSCNAIYKLSVFADENFPNKPLQISHSPPIQGSESIKVAQAIRSDHLSIEKLLVHTIHVRALAKLKELERELRVIVPGPCETRDIPTVLYVPVLYPCMQGEKLSIAVDIQKGKFLVSLSMKETNLTREIQESINSDKKDLRRLLSKLRLWIALQRCQKSIQHNVVNTTCLEYLPLTNLSGHPLEELSDNKLFIKLPKQVNYYLVVEVTETYKRCVDYKYYVLDVSPSCFKEATPEQAKTIPKIFFKAGQLGELDKFASTHGPGSKIHDVEPEDPNPLTRKRKLFKKDNSGPTQKKIRNSPYYVPELPHILALCEDRLPFALLGRELQKKGIAYSDIEVDGEGIGLSMSLLNGIPVEGLSPDILEKIAADLISCKFRVQRKGSRPTWFLEAVFWNCPVPSINPKEVGPVHRVFFSYEMVGPDAAQKTVQNLINDWTGLAYLYQLAIDFGDMYEENDRFLIELEVKNYNYKRLILSYGPNKCYTLTVCYKAVDKKEFKSAVQTGGEKKYHVVLGTNGQTNISNCHLITHSYLEHILNETKSLPYLAQVVLDTWSPLCSLGKLNTTPMLGLITNSHQATADFIYLPQSAVHFKVLFRETYCLEVHCRSNRAVAIRDGAYSLFETSKLVETYTPIPGLKAFLNLFVDESNTNAARRRSTTEDDHPPSPIGMDSSSTLDSFMTMHQTQSTSPVKGLTFKSPLDPPSNPLTPASPSKMQQHVATPGAPFPLTSPPSLGAAITPSPSNMMAPSPSSASLTVPSPGSFIPAPSPSSLGIHMPSPANQFISPQGMLDSHTGSPYTTAPSAKAHFTETHQMPGTMLTPPSRMLPQQLWAASIPTLISHDAFENLLRPCQQFGKVIEHHPLSPLERFLGCVFLKRHMQRMINTETATTPLQLLQSAEAGTLLFKGESLQYKVNLNSIRMQCLVLRVTPLPEFAAQWDKEELLILEKFFDKKAVANPYRPNAVISFLRILASPLKILKDFIQIMKLELEDGVASKWRVCWCLTMPHDVPLAGTEAGVPAMVLREKILIILELTSNEVPAPGKEAESIVVPILYVKSTNETQFVDKNVSPPSPKQAAIKEMLRKFHQFNPSLKDCSIFPALMEVLKNLDTNMGLSS